jgi:hypothetical protein
MGALLDFGQPAMCRQLAQLRHYLELLFGLPEAQENSAL